MKSSTIAIISVVTLIALHAVHFFFGFKGTAVALLTVAAFYGVAFLLYWRQLRKLHKVTRDLPPEFKEVIYEVGGFDEEARKDMAKLEQKDRGLHEEA